MLDRIRLQRCPVGQNQDAAGLARGATSQCAGQKERSNDNEERNEDLHEAARDPSRHAIVSRNPHCNILQYNQVPEANAKRCKHSPTANEKISRQRKGTIAMKGKEPNWNPEPEPIPVELLEPQCRFQEREPPTRFSALCSTRQSEICTLPRRSTAFSVFDPILLPRVPGLARASAEFGTSKPKKS